jgi:hypothetical protein
MVTSHTDASYRQEGVVPGGAASWAGPVSSDSGDQETAEGASSAAVARVPSPDMPRGLRRPTVVWKPSVVRSGHSKEGL